MRLAGKLTAALVLGILLVMAAYAYLEVQQEVVLFDADLQRARQVGLAWLSTIESVWVQEGPARVRDLVKLADARTGGIILRLLALDPSIDDLPRPDISAADLRMLTAGKMVRLVRHDGDHDWRHIYAPITVDGTHPVAVEVIESLTRQHTFIRMSRWGIGLATLAIVVVCGAIATALQYRLVGRPMRLLRDKARRVGEGDFSGPARPAPARRDRRAGGRDQRDVRAARRGAADSSRRRPRRASRRSSSCATPTGSRPSASSPPASRTSSARRSTSSRRAPR